jgi:NADH-quinone oxidoreductase subunit H
MIDLLIIVIKVSAVIGVVLLTVPFMILAERKISAWLQDRIGPNRAGPGGIIQPFADGLKLFFKEDYNPPGVDMILFFLAPSIAMFMALVALAVIPFSGDVQIGERIVSFQIGQVNIGILYVLGVGSLAVYGVVVGGWASNNKYSFLGGLRAAAQMISYEVPMTLAILSLIVITGTLRLEEIVNQQIEGCWYVLTQPLTFLIFLICMFAETNRAPFDLAECEQELVAGFHTEYSSMKFAMFFLGEYAHIIVASSLSVVMFFGGWHLPGLPVPSDGPLTLPMALLGVLIFYVKIWMFIFFFMWVRWTLPRFRYDQLMRMAWYGLVPLGLGMLMLNSVIAFYPTDTTQSRWWQLGANVALVIVMLLVAAVSQVKMAKDNTQLAEYARG